MLQRISRENLERRIAYARPVVKLLERGEPSKDCLFPDPRQPKRYWSIG